MYIEKMWGDGSSIVMREESVHDEKGIVSLG